jgi:probable O-glycosylation ligase (exosortase A-associated)
VPAQGKWPFRLLLLYLVIEYGRPMDEIPALNAIHPGLIVGALLVLTWITRKNLSALTSSPQIRWIWLMTFLLAIYVPFARNNYFAYMETLTILRYIPIFVSIVLYVDTYQRLRSFVNAWLALLVFVSIKGIFGKGIGGSSFLADENDFSLLMNMMLPFGVSLFLYARSIRRRIVWLGASMVGVVSDVVAQSRGGFVGLLAVAATFWIFSKKKVLSSLMIVVLGVVLFLATTPAYWADMSTSTEAGTGTAKERLDSWHAAWEIFKAQPLGVGGGNFPVWFPRYQPYTMKRDMWGRAAHSLWFTLLPELGIFGVAIYLSLLFVNLRDIVWLRRIPAGADDNIRYVNHLAVAFLASFAGYFASGTFLSVLYYPHYYYLTALIVATRRIVERSRVTLAPAGAAAGTLQHDSRPGALPFLRTGD